MSKLPKKLSDYIDNYKETRTTYVEIVDTYRKQLIVRIFAVKFHKWYGPMYLEIYNATEKRQKISSDFIYTGCGGWVVIWHEKYSPYMGTLTPQHKMFDWNGNMPSMSKVQLWTLEEVKAIDTSLKYLTFEGSHCWDLIGYVKQFKKYPGVELLSKMGMQYFYTDSRVLKLQGKAKSEFLNWVKQHKDYVLSHHPSYTFIRGCINRNMTPEENKKYYALSKYRNQLGDLKLAFTIKEMAKVENYLENQKCGITLYRDYLGMAKKLGKDITEYGVKYPKNLRQAHDNAIEILKAKHDKEIEINKQKFEAIKDEINSASDLLKIVIPSCSKQFVEVGNKLHNCVGTYGFDKKMAKGEILILFIEKENEPVECCELRVNKSQLSLVQLRGDHNFDSAYHKQAEQLVKGFMREYTKKYATMQLAC